MKHLRNILVATALVGATGGVLIAQPGTDAKPAVPAAAAAKPDPNAPKPLTLQEMRVAVTSSLTISAEDEKTVHRLRIAAKKDKDVIKLNCVNDKLVQINGLLNLLDDSVEAFKAAAVDNNTDDARAPHGDISDKGGQIRRLKEEALACFGDELGHVGDGDVEVDGPDMPDDTGGSFPGNDLEPPIYVTPWS